MIAERESHAAPEKSAQELFHDLRVWIQANLSDGVHIRQSCYQGALTANLHRFMKWGPDETLDHMTARDLCFILLYVNGATADYLLRRIFVRALIEGDMLVYEHLAQLPFMREQTVWYWRVVAGILGQASDPKETTRWVENMPPFEKSIVRLMCMRVFPDLGVFSWLDDVPPDCPLLAWKIYERLVAQSQYTHACENWLRDHPEVRNAQYY